MPGKVYKVTVEAVDPAGGAKSAPVSVRARSWPSISGTPKDATAGEPYSYQFAVNGTPPPTVADCVPNICAPLPRGLSLSTSGLLSGTPTQAGTFPLTLAALNGSGPIATYGPFITVNPATAGRVNVKAGADQSTKPMKKFGTKLSVLVTDEYADPLSGINITFKVVSGSASFPKSARSATVITSGAGVAIAPSLTAGKAIGKVTVSATTPGFRSASFTLHVKG
jgi:hypothetical protein